MDRILHSAAETEAFGGELLRVLPEKCVVFLHGQLGAGKTTLVRGLLRAMGYNGKVKSPTYTLAEEYDCNGRKLIHFDLYRVADPEELEFIGIRDYFEQNALCFIEWPEMGRGVLPEADVVMELTVIPDGRRIHFEKVPEKMQKELHSL